MATIGRYELGARLGQGGFATVYSAWDPVLKRDVAVKVLHPILAADDQQRHRFQAEAQRLAQLKRHPNTVFVFDAGEDEGQPFFAMELVNGSTLADLLSSGKHLSIPRIVEIVGSLGAALDHLHAAGLVHRDVHPENVILAVDGRTVLTDLGIARSLTGAPYTQVGLLIGRAGVVAPEQIRGEEVGPAADVYALGALTYELLAGAPPFRGEPAHVLYAELYEPPPALEDVRPGLQPGVYTALEAALAKSPAS